jgi:hypothetical protein
MSDLRLIFTRIKPESIDNSPPTFVESQPTLPPANRGPQVQQSPDPITQRASGNEIWAFSANLDQLAVHYGQANSVLGYYSLIQDLFVELRNSEDTVLAGCSFLVWADGYPTHKKVKEKKGRDSYWMFYITGDQLHAKVIKFIKGFLRTRPGWTETGSMRRLPQESFPMFEYASGTISTFFASIVHPNDQKSIGSPDIFYQGDEAILGFSRVPYPLKRVRLSDAVKNPLSFNVRMMDEVVPGCIIKVNKDLPPIHPCGLTEEELIAACPGWESFTLKDGDLVRKYGPPLDSPIETPSAGEGRNAGPADQEPEPLEQEDEANETKQIESKISRVLLCEIKNEELHSTITLKIESNGDLVIEGQDIGEYVEQLRGHDEYEYKLIVDGQYKDSILLHLIKDRFESDAEFRTWLEGKGIPSRFYSRP